MKIIAHRGASGEFPENSLLAFEQAIKQQADGIELDARYHQASGKFVLLHDAYVAANADKELYFDNLPLEELLAVTNNNQPLTTLEQALAIIDGQCSVNIELKVTADTVLLQTIVDTLQQLLDEFTQKKQFTYSQFIISTFYHPLLLKVKQQIPQVDTAALIAHCPLTFDEFTQRLHVASVNPSIDCLTQHLVDSIHQQGLAVSVYTVNRRQDVIQCLRLGVDAIFTNYPARSKLIIKESMNKKN